MPSKSILVIDDDKNLRKSMALILSRTDYHVDTAGSAAEALADLETQKYDLVIVDMMMPDGSSVLLPRLLRLYDTLPILVLSAQVSAEIGTETSRQGAYARLVKPVTPEALLERVKSLLEKKPYSDQGAFPQQIFV